MDQIVDISTDGRYLSRERGFLKVSDDGDEVGRVPFDQIAGVIVHAHGTTWSTSLLVELAERGVPVVLCAANHAPKSVLLPLEGHHLQGARMRAQWQAKAPFLKQAWKQVIIAKIQMQAAALDAVGESPFPLHMMTRKVQSGDPTNVEAQAARHYWPRLMGPDFRRDTGGSDENALLNYGYTVLRAATSRAVVAAGLHPTIGLFHANRGNAFAMADDLMEPFRPLVDLSVRRIVQEHGPDVDSSAKIALARLIATDLPLGDGITPVSVALSKLTTSLGQSFEATKLRLALPNPPDKLTLASLGQCNGD
ncbi:type II CRISPR-associated endonuclease Cas1 [Sulfitobacter donghicola]|uniref:CRISPR-associated endonuclease Cas1 n=1 Tax=Sulfitobacter donghicola DSW-25 = KCTC 12864 = JCM 14565 TaxID=1300350 RepID=A0A073IWP5_9RHOB|nr:type II CRISPR-associated endonuclease Cas1 [Sulfitobacter donghicola]KEJ89807.1 CRISPR-associated protein Cas1 [Sulfitobacter donghicola DSW-25 = KCTC 12864 = JCM 14565]KIN67083.1 CRISPR-associated endonuclease Cas1 [Sulfitobacter donghicola DSW-25 = KCTC 12864 = JCM 14565]